MVSEEKGQVSTTRIIIIMFAVIMLIAAIGVFIGRVYPYMRYGFLSPCWAGTVANVNTLSGFDLLREPQDIFVGDCISAIYILNEDDLKAVSTRIKDDFKKILDCPEGGKSYVIGVPSLEILGGGHLTWNILKLKSEAIKEIKSQFLTKFGVVSYCKILSRERVVTNPTAFNKVGETYCVDIAKDKETDTYIVYYCEGSCDEKCGPNPYNPGLFEPDEPEGGATSTWQPATNEILFTG